MALYDLPKFSIQTQKRSDVEPSKKKIKEKKFWPEFQQSRVTPFLLGVILFSTLFGFIGGGIIGGYSYWKVSQELKILQASIPGGARIIEKNTIIEKEYIPQTSQEERIISVVAEVSPAVVSIILTKDEPVFERIFSDPFEEFFGPSPFQVPELRQRGTERREIGGGSGFFVSADGMIVTNRHVVLRDDVDYTVLTNDGNSYPAKVLARDPIQDLALIEIDRESIVSAGGTLPVTPFPFVKLGNSDTLKIGQTVIAIGNALGEFRNTVSTGVISGLGRTITASDGSNFVETIEDVIQTDAAINRGNSGGPLLNLAGEVIGVNTATVLQAQSIGFAIPVNKVKRDVEQVREFGKIVYAFLGVRYVAVTQQVQEAEELPVDYGVLILEGESEPGIMPDSAAEKAGLKEHDIILELNGEKITRENSLAKLIQRFDPGDMIILKILRDTQEQVLVATLGERSE